MKEKLRGICAFVCALALFSCCSGKEERSYRLDLQGIAILAKDTLAVNYHYMRGNATGDILADMLRGVPSGGEMPAVEIARLFGWRFCDISISGYMEQEGAINRRIVYVSPVNISLQDWIEGDTLFLVLE
jgi:hypothetical protein